MPFELRQSTARTVPIGPFLDEDDGKTTEEGLTISQADCRVNKNGAGAAQKNDSDAAAHDENGWYLCPLDATDTNTLGELVLSVHESGALPVWREFSVITQQAWDSKYSTDTLQVDVAQWNNTNIATPDTAGYPKITIKDGTGTGEIDLSSGGVLVSTLATQAKADVNAEADTAISDASLSTHAAADVWSHASGVTILADVAAIDALVEASGNGDLAAIKTAVDAILVDTGTDGVVVAAASKTGYALSATGLDSIPVTDPAGVASTFPEMVVQTWRRWFMKATQTATQIKTYKDDGTTPETTQTVSDDATTQTMGAAS